MILALLLGMAQVASAPDDDRVYRIGGGTHVLTTRLLSDFFGNPSNRASLVGPNFERACAAHFLAQRRIERAYSDALRREVIAGVRAIVPVDRLAHAGEGAFVTGPLIPWNGRFHDEMNRRAGDLLERASAEHQRLAEDYMARLPSLPEERVSPDRADANASQLVIACATYFGMNREGIIAMEQVEEID